MKPGIDFPGLGVGLAVVSDAGLLLYRRLLSPEAGCWSIVGGKVDHMEPAELAARREAEEESGIVPGAVEFLCVSEQIFAQESQHWVSLIYVCEDFQGAPRVTEPDKMPEFGWFPLDALPSPLSRFARDAARAIKQQRASAASEG